MTVADHITAIKAWIDENPIRRKRAKIRASKENAAVFMGVALSSLKSWEVGAHRPTPPSMKRIALFLEVSEEEAQRIWDEWWEKRPGRSEITDQPLVGENGGRPY